jgi:endonuclease YncB( thermonuclease family)
VYSVTVTTGSGCSGTATVSVTGGCTTAVTASVGGSVCEGGTLSFSASAGTSYSWSGVGSFSSTLQAPVRNLATLSHAGVYSVSVTTSASCTGSSTVSAVVNQMPFVGVSAPSDTVCHGVNMTLSLTGVFSGGVTSNWQSAARFYSGQATAFISSAQYIESSGFSVTATGANGCVKTGSVSVHVRDTRQPSISGSPSLTITSGTVLTLSSAPGWPSGTSYSWSGPLGWSSTVASPQLVPPSIARTGGYSVTQSIGGCTAMATVWVIVHVVNSRLSQAVPVSVVRVIDADTYEVLNAGEKRIVRLYNVDAPEIGQAFGKEARDSIRQVFSVSAVKVLFGGRDIFNRWLGDVYVNNQRLDSLTVRKGWAWYNVEYSYDQGIQALQSTAEAENKGLWLCENPCPPWLFRRMNARNKVIYCSCNR